MTRPDGVLAATSADPHISGFDADKFDFTGLDGRIYCLYTSGTVQINARIRELPDDPSRTYLSEVGIVVGSDAVGLTVVTTTAELDFLSVPKSLVNGERVRTRPVAFPTGLFGGDGHPVIGKVWLAAGNLQVETGPLIVNVERCITDKFLKFTPHLNVTYRVTEMGLLSDGVAPHGIVGQTADFDGYARRAHGPDGEGAIEGVAADYEVPELTHTSFKFSRFGQVPTMEPRYGVYSEKVARAVLL